MRRAVPCFLLLLGWSRCAYTAGVSKVPLYLDNPDLDLDPSRRVKNTAYYGEFSIGTPPQKFLGCLDTGSADVWVSSPQCTDQSCESHKEFLANASSSFQAANYNFQVRYATGSVNGYVSIDTLSIGSPSITVKNQTFGLASTSSADFIPTTCDGLFGLGLVPLSQIGTPPPFFNMLQAGLLSQALFSIWLNPDPRQLDAGELVLGGIDESRYSGELIWVPVNSTMYWDAVLTSTLVGNATVQLSAQAAILDSGSSAFMFSNEDAAAFHQAMPGVEYSTVTNTYHIKCGCDDQCMKTLPNITFVLAGKKFVVEPEAYIIRANDNQCWTAVMPGARPGAVVLGSYFMRRWYSVYKWTPQGGVMGLAVNNASSNKTSSGDDDSQAGAVSSATAQSNQLALDLRSSTAGTGQVLQNKTSSTTPGLGRRRLK